MRSIVAAILWALAVPALATPIASNIRIVPTVSVVNGGQSARDEGRLEVGQGDTTDPLAGALSATATAGDATVTAGSEISATWADAGMGRVTITDFWVATTVLQPANSNFFMQPGGFFSYDFIADADGIFSVAYQVETPIAEPDLFGIGNGFTIWFLDALVGTRRVTTGIDAPGVANFDVIAGNTYRLSLQTSGLSISVPLRDREMRQTGIFDWSGPIDSVRPPMPVTEPASGILLGIGLAAIGFARRRRAVTEA